MTGAASRKVDGPWHHGQFSITCSRSPRPDLMADFWPLYEESFGPLRVLAAARQVFTEAEFAAELDDGEIWKYVALDAQGRPAGLTTVTDRVSAMPWLSPDYFEHHYPDEWGRGAVYYIGATLVRPQMRGDRVFAMMAKHVAQRVAATRGVLGYDICGHNDHKRSLARVTGKILHRVAEFQVGPVDVQTYYVARAIGNPKEGSDE